MLGANSLLGQAVAARQGLGLVALPCYLSDVDGELQRLGEIMRRNGSTNASRW